MLATSRHLLVDRHRVPGHAIQAGPWVFCGNLDEGSPGLRSFRMSITRDLTLTPLGTGLAGSVGYVTLSLPIGDWAARCEGTILPKLLSRARHVVPTAFSSRRLKECDVEHRQLRVLSTPPCRFPKISEVLGHTALSDAIFPYWGYRLARRARSLLSQLGNP